MRGTASRLLDASRFFFLRDPSCSKGYPPITGQLDTPRWSDFGSWAQSSPKKLQYWPCAMKNCLSSTA